jgi:hypothetical protein
METLLIRYLWLLEANQAFRIHHLQHELEPLLTSVLASSPHSSSTSDTDYQQQNDHHHTSISQLALQSLLSSEVDCVLVGMRRPTYVQSIMKGLTSSRLTKEQLVQLGQRAWSIINEQLRASEQYRERKSSPTPSNTSSSPSSTQ